MNAGRIVTTGTVAEVVGSHPARISFAPPVPVRLPDLAGTHVVEGVPGERLTLHTKALQDTLTELLLWARRHGVELRGLDALSASLGAAIVGRCVVPPR